MTIFAQPVAELDICIAEDGRSFELVLPEPGDLEWFMERLKDTGKITANRQTLIWKQIIFRDNSRYEAQDLANYLQAAWQEVHEEITPPPTPAPVTTISAAPRSGMRGLAEMADEMQMSEEELYRRLESREWDYKFKAYPKGERDATGKVVVSGHEYLFDKRAAAWNIKNKDNLKKME